MEKKFIDLFAGCGGLSLGLIKSGWKGLFAIEKSSDAFRTLKHNLVDGRLVEPFDWPSWLPCEAMTTGQLLERYKSSLVDLAGSIDLIAGGPPCQGFSFAGRRNPLDPRNRLTAEYIEIVELIKPRFLLLENVKGFASAFKSKELNRSDPARPYSEIVSERLTAIGYTVYHRMLKASKFGVPQPRPRFIMIAVRADANLRLSPFEILEALLMSFRSDNGLHTQRDISVGEAISDLEITKSAVVKSHETSGFNQIQYVSRQLSSYQRLMRSGLDEDFTPNSLRLPNHNEETTKRFETILRNYPKGKGLKKADLERLGTKKHSFTPLHPDMLSRTITTLPDDLLHYSEPRILTVRENARIQSFPDWFDFLGKYTTGGTRRKEECPRYSQVGNAVPPLMAEALGRTLRQWEATEE